MPCGLAIYKSLLMSHDGLYNATIAGCHEAFEFFAELAGGVAPLLRTFEANLRDLKDGNLPKISYLPPTFEEIQAPKVQNLQFEPLEGMTDLIGEDGTFEEKGEDWESIEHCEHCEYEGELVESERDQGDIAADAAKEQVCGNDIVTVADSEPESAGEEHAPTVALLTAGDFQRMKDQEAGLHVDYCCAVETVSHAKVQS